MNCSLVEQCSFFRVLFGGQCLIYYNMPPGPHAAGSGRAHRMPMPTTRPAPRPRSPARPKAGTAKAAHAQRPPSRAGGWPCHTATSRDSLKTRDGAHSPRHAAKTPLCVRERGHAKALPGRTRGRDTAAHTQDKGWRPLRSPGEALQGRLADSPLPGPVPRGHTLAGSFFIGVWQTPGSAPRDRTQRASAVGLTGTFGESRSQSSTAGRSLAGLLLLFHFHPFPPYQRHLMSRTGGAPADTPLVPLEVGSLIPAVARASPVLGSTPRLCQVLLPLSSDQKSAPSHCPRHPWPSPGHPAVTSGFRHGTLLATPYPGPCILPST